MQQTWSSRLIPILTLALLAPSAAAQTRPDPRELLTVGGPNAFTRPPLETGADLQELFRDRREDILTVLEKAGWDGDPEVLFRAVREGAFTERTFPVGGRLEWMAYRSPSKVDVMRDVVWAGDEPFGAFEIRLPWQGLLWVFVVPKACGNLSLSCELTVFVSAGELRLTDPKTGTEVVGAGEIQTVTAACPAPGEIRPGEAGAETTVAVDEGRVEFMDYGRPISVSLEADDAVSATVSPEGQLALVASEDNAGAIQMRIGDAVAELSPGGSIFADWTLPVCKLAVSPTSGFVGQQFTFDASASSVSHGALATVELELVDPEGRKSALAPERAGVFRWTRAVDDPGEYRVRATAVSDGGKRSPNECAATFEVRAFPIQQASFRAERDRAGGIVVRWETVQEIGLAGFHVYRARVGGEPVRVTETAIVAWGAPHHGAVYEFPDTPPGPGVYRYRLELVDGAGNAIPYGEPSEVAVE